MSLNNQVSDNINGLKESNNKTSLLEIDPKFLVLMANRLNRNKDKYPLNNWKKPMEVLPLIDAMERHFIDLKSLILDEQPVLTTEEFLDHLAAIACNCQFIYHQLYQQGK